MTAETAAAGPPFRAGVDILEIARMEKSLSNPRFLTRLFSLREQEQYREQGCRANFLAGSFCAKEAFSKALGTGIRNFALQEVEVLRNGLGKPYFRFSGRALEIVESQGLHFDVSISHSGDNAIAFVIAWREQGLGGMLHEGGHSPADEGN